MRGTRREQELDWHYIPSLPPVTSRVPTNTVENSIIVILSPTPCSVHVQVMYVPCTLIDVCSYFTHALDHLYSDHLHGT